MSLQLLSAMLAADSIQDKHNPRVMWIANNEDLVTEELPKAADGIVAKNTQSVARGMKSESAWRKGEGWRKEETQMSLANKEVHYGDQLDSIRRDSGQGARVR